MRAYQVTSPGDIDTHNLKKNELPIPEPIEGEVLIRVEVCGICHTDLHLAEGDIAPHTYPITPGHQVVGVIERFGSRSNHAQFNIGDRVGLPWLYSTCGKCEFCLSGQSNLCQKIQFTGFHINGGFAEFLIARIDFLIPLPLELDAIKIAPFLCAGIVGYRSLMRSGVQEGDKVALVGFGASAHLMIQLLKVWNCDVSVITRSQLHQNHARVLGASFSGSFENSPPKDHQRVVIFTPAGESVTNSLGILKPGGVISINAIHMSNIPSIQYQQIYGERTITTTTNATFQDGLDFIKLAFKHHLQAETTVYQLDEISQALRDLKHSRFNGEGVIQVN